jgi:putative transposase
MTVILTDFTRRRLSDELERCAASNGEVPRNVRRALARQFGITDDHLRRLIRTDALHPGQTEALTDEQLAYLAVHQSATETWKALVADGKFAKSLSTFKRRLMHVNRALFEAIVHGDEAMRNRFPYLKFEADGVNDTWQQDSAHTDTTVLDGRNRVVPWMELIIDDRSRNIMGVQLWPKAPDAELATTTMAMAVSGRLTPNGAPAKPRVVRHDQGSYYTGDHYATALGLNNIVPNPVPGYSPHLKGKVERVIRTIRAEFLNKQPGAHRVAKALGEDRTGPGHDASDQLLTLEELRWRLMTYVEYYNNKRPHGALDGRTPAEVYVAGAEPTEMGEIGVRALLRRPSQRRKVSKNGIRWNGVDYTHPDLLAGLVVDVAPHPDDDTVLEVFHGGSWLCTARPHRFFIADPKDFYAERRRIGSQARRIRAEASQIRSSGTPSVEERDDAEHDALLHDLIGGVARP